LGGRVGAGMQACCHLRLIGSVGGQTVGGAFHQHWNGPQKAPVASWQAWHDDPVSLARRASARPRALLASSPCPACCRVGVGPRFSVRDALRAGARRDAPHVFRLCANRTASAVGVALSCSSLPRWRSCSSFWRLWLGARCMHTTAAKFNTPSWSSLTLPTATGDGPVACHRAFCLPHPLPRPLPLS